MDNVRSGTSSPSQADVDRNRTVDFVDFALWARHWLKPKVYTVAYDPYEGVDWNRWHRALAQHHDHMGRLSLEKIKAYDRAGYNVIVPLDYAGKKSGGAAYCDYRLWPVHKYLSCFDSDEELLASLQNIRLFIPSMEEIGCHHMTSPFLTEYIELWEPDYCQTKQQWHYETSQQCIDLINTYGGMAIIAHPTDSAETYMELEGYLGIEIVNGYHYCKWRLKDQFPDYPNYIGHFQALWDHLLTHRDTRIWGFAVNDWFGPYDEDCYSNEDYIYQAYWDCGKIIVMIPTYTVDDYRSSLEMGRFLAIHDWGPGKENKNRYPKIAAIAVNHLTIAIDTDGYVTWIANGEKVARGNVLNLTELATEENYRYVRAEIKNHFGIVFTQPWTLACLGE